ncbi:HEAT repeat domain-containing protein [candidate division KSB1 bacterium]|nr:HEAT repeat domain-containing protein [candidate division KSB1 bacterium]
MKCNTIREKFPDYLQQALSSKERTEVETHLSQCSACHAEFDEVKSTWELMGSIPDDEPNPALSERFYTMLDAYKHGMASTRNQNSGLEKITAWLSQIPYGKPAFQFGFAVVCIIIGFLFGRQANFKSASTNDITELRNEVTEMRTLISLSLLDQPSSSDRLKGISWSQRVTTPNKSLVTALLNTLNTDPSVNVRLEAVDALYIFSSDPDIRQALIKSLSNQSSPLVQISIINALVELHEQKSLDALRRLIHNESINPSVQQKAKWGIDQLS